jgi:C2 domain
MYQGEWSGIPLCTPMKPHGEGLVVFMDGWGFSRELKVVNLRIVRCSHLPAVSLDSSYSDPYCLIYCNNKLFRTTTKWGTLHPHYEETFEMDVTNPLATLRIEVRDFPKVPIPGYKGAFLGQKTLTIGNYKDGRPHHMVCQLKGINKFTGGDSDQKYDRGEIELEIKWGDRLYEFDLELRQMKTVMARRLQCWARKMAAKNRLKEYRKEREELQKMASRASELVSSAIRMKIAIRRVAYLKLYKIAALKIQLAVRVYQAKCKLYNRRIEYKNATIIVCACRCYLARKLLARLLAQRNELWRVSTTRWI